MSVQDNFRLDSLILIPYWLTLFAIPGSLILTPLFMVGYTPSSLVSLSITILSVITAYFLIKRYRVLAFKTMIGLAVLFTVFLAFGFGLIGYESAGFGAAVFTALATLAVSYAIHKYAFTRSNSKSIFLFL